VRVALRRATPAPETADDTVPFGLRIAGAYSWRILLVVGVLAVVIFLIIQFRYIVIPFLVSVLLGALLVPFVGFLQRHRWPKWLAVAVAMLGTLGIIAGLIVLVVAQVRAGYSDLQEKSVQAYENFTQWLLDSPWHLTEADINAWIGAAWEAIQRDSQALVSGVLSVGSTAGHVGAGILLALFSTLFILIDGRRIWTWIVGLFPRRAHAAVTGAGEAGWITLTTFVKVQIFVAFVDAVGIGLGAWILGLFFGGFPLVIPIAVAVFLGSFIPVVGALITGALAVFVALVYLGPVPAVIMLGIVLLVQQIEGHVLQPLVLGTAVKVHPLAVVFAVAAGGFTAGIAGALFAVPVVAVANVMITYLVRGGWRTTPHPTPEDVLPHE
jgi:predicted PurR-regulated permease PerM